MERFLSGHRLNRLFPDIASQSLVGTLRYWCGARSVFHEEGRVYGDHIGEEYDASGIQCRQAWLYWTSKYCRRFWIQYHHLPGFIILMSVTLRGEKSGVTFRVGQEIRIRLKERIKWLEKSIFYIPRADLDLKKAMCFYVREARSISKRRPSKKEGERKQVRLLRDNKAFSKRQEEKE